MSDYDGFINCNNLKHNSSKNFYNFWFIIFDEDQNSLILTMSLFHNKLKNIFTYKCFLKDKKSDSPNIDLNNNHWVHPLQTIYQPI
jgi:hypothetical protein